jgi:hypothetical protein
MKTLKHPIYQNIKTSERKAMVADILIASDRGRRIFSYAASADSSSW